MVDLLYMLQTHIPKQGFCFFLPFARLDSMGPLVHRYSGYGFYNQTSEPLTESDPAPHFLDQVLYIRDYVVGMGYIGFKREGVKKNVIHCWQNRN